MAATRTHSKAGKASADLSFETRAWPCWAEGRREHTQMAPPDIRSVPVLVIVGPAWVPEEPAGSQEPLERRQGTLGPDVLAAI